MMERIVLKVSKIQADKILEEYDYCKQTIGSFIKNEFGLSRCQLLSKYPKYKTLLGVTLCWKKEDKIKVTLLVSKLLEFDQSRVIHWWGRTMLLYTSAIYGIPNENYDNQLWYYTKRETIKRLVYEKSFGNLS